MLSQHTDLYRRRVERLVQENTGLVYHILDMLYDRTYDYHQYEDFAQIGLLALFRAAETYDPDRGFRFSTYACVIIKHELWRALTLHLRNGFSRGKNEAKLVSLFQEAGDGSGEAGFAYWLTAPASNTDALLDAKRVHEFIPYLPPLERDIIRLRFFPPELTLVQLGQRFRLSKEWIRQLIIEALTKLQDWMSGNEPLPDLLPDLPTDRELS